MSDGITLRKSNGMSIQKLQTLAEEALEHERERAEAMVHMLTQEITVYEARHHMSTEEFLVAFDAGLGDDEDYFLWYGAAHIRADWLRHLNELRGVTVEPN